MKPKDIFGRLASKGSDITPCLLLASLACIFFFKVVLSPGQIIYAEYFSDVISRDSPFYNLLFDSFQKFGRIPFWNPFSYSGQPMDGNPLVALFFPVNWIFAVVSPNQAFGFIFLLYVAISGIATYLFAKTIGLGKYGSLLSALSFMFSGHMVIRTYGGNLDNVGIYMLMPVVMLFIERSLKEKDLSYVGMAGFAVGMQLLGNTATAMYSFFAEGLYFILRIAYDDFIEGWVGSGEIFAALKKSALSRWNISAVVIFLSVAILISAVQLMPSYVLATQTLRAERIGSEIGSGYAMPMKQFVTFIAPESFGTFLDYSYWGERNFWELVMYVSVTTSLLASSTLLTIKRKDGLQKYKIIFATLFIFSILFVVEGSPLFQLFFKYVPGFSLFRKPSIMLLLTSISLSLLGGIGLDSILSEDSVRKEKLKVDMISKLPIILSLLAILVIASLVLLKPEVYSYAEKLLLAKYSEFTSTVHPLKYGIDWYKQLIPVAFSHIVWSIATFAFFCATFGALASLYFTSRIGKSAFAILVLVICVADLWAFGMKYISVTDPAQVFSERIPLSLLNRSEPFRMADGTFSFPQFIAMNHGIEIINGYDPSSIERYTQLIYRFFGPKDSNPLSDEPYTFKLDTSSRTIDRLDLLNVRYIFSNSTINASGFSLSKTISVPVYDQYVRTSKNQTVYVYEASKFLPRAYVVPNAEVMDKEHVLDALSDPKFDPTNTVILEEIPNESESKLQNAGVFTAANVITYPQALPDEVRIRVATSHDGYLVLSQNWYPGWKAYDNGKEARIYLADYAFDAIYLPAGEHDVIFRYQPDTFVPGSLLSISCAISVIFAFIATRLRRARH
jgi:hypothetical protein